MLIKLTGYIEFEPENVTKKHNKQSSWKNVAMIRTDCDIDQYYAWFLRKRFNLFLDKPLRGAHITFISDKIIEKAWYERAKNLFDKKPIEFYIDIEPASNGEHWWLRAYSQEAEIIRDLVGLERRPFFPFHLSLGHSNIKTREHSEYILRVCKKFNLINHKSRAEFDEKNVRYFTL